MRLLQTLAAALLPLSVFAAKNTSGERFQKYQAQQISNGGPVKLTDVKYESLTKAPRDYSVALIMTAMDARFACGICHEVQPEWDMLARSWVKGDKNEESRVIFGTMDFLDGKETFQAMALQTAPVLFLFHPTTGLHGKPNMAPSRYDFATGPSSAEAMHAWLSRQLPDRPHPPLVRPINYIRIAVVTTSILGLITLFTVAAPYVLPVVQNRNLWAALSLIAVLLFTSGHMFNHIRKVPYVTQDGKGGVQYFAGGFQNQFGLETQIVAAMYGVLAFATISLALKVPRISDPRTQQVAIIIWGVVLWGMYSFLLHVFRIKNGGYIIWLPPFF